MGTMMGCCASLSVRVINRGLDWQAPIPLSVPVGSVVIDARFVHCQESAGDTAGIIGVACCHIAADQLRQIEIDEEALRAKIKTHVELFPPARDVAGQSQVDIFLRLLRNIVIRRTAQIAHHVQGHTEGAGNLCDLELSGRDELRLFCVHRQRLEF